MNKQESLKPIDVAVVVALALRHPQTASTYSELAEELAVSASTVHGSVQRLQKTGLLRAGSREPNLHELRNYLVHGVKHSFPPILGRVMKGVPTAHSGPALSDQFESSNPFVWPDVHGSIRGTSLTPLYPRAVRLPAHSPQLYQVLTLIDALRVGGLTPV